MRNDEPTKLLQYYARQMDTLGVYRPRIRSDFLGGVCQRRVWSELRRVKVFSPSVRELRRRAMKEVEIQRLLKECVIMGWEVHTVHPKTRAPMTFQNEHLDVRMTALGKCKEAGQEPAGWFLVEVDVVTQAMLKELLEGRLKRVHPRLYAHCQLGMGFSGLKQAAVYLSSMDGDYYVEILEFDESEFKRLVALAELLHGSWQAPEKEEAVWCWSCEYQDPCYNEAFVPKPSCPNCCQAVLQADGLFCRQWENLVAEDVWAEGCTEHVFLPSLLNFAKKREERRMLNKGMVVTYEMKDGQVFSNGGQKNLDNQDLNHPMYTSQELALGGQILVSDPTIREMKETFLGSQIVKQTE